MEVGQVRRRRPARLKSASRDRVFYPSKRHRSFPDRDDVTQSREKQNVDPTMRLAGAPSDQSKGLRNSRKCESGPRGRHGRHHQLSCHRLSPHARLGGSAANQQRAPGCLVSQDAQDDVRLLAPP
ncbi:hypothetical protein BGZ61DRAFT_477846 [Ilyonectria robusta]|uniref:uncharacterized protein n=1 Tax=Ilyonectria robusta TaxID=1079257 RepID=UPI001E8E9896|nr:uncharacterized protein BGZ61DRAFT_477846 [Ilyonectria robusta]KAH8699892.1 hypothetical protein BGZ61DRAFT_477846 [Ilyonectria robusta]